jgi:hypothetical protein
MGVQQLEQLGLAFISDFLIRFAIVANSFFVKRDIRGAFRQNAFTASIHFLLVRVRLRILFTLSLILSHQGREVIGGTDILSVHRFVVNVGTTLVVVRF